MKRILTLLLPLVLLVISCKKKEIISPTDENDETESGVYMFNGEKFDNQRVSIPEAKDVTINNTLYVSKFDSTFVADSTSNLTWTVLVPENESVKAEWIFELDAPFLKSEKKFWHSTERIWRYVFSVNLNDPRIQGRGKLTINMLNEVTGEAITRDYFVTVNLNVDETDVNTVRFGMSKEEVQRREWGWLNYEKPDIGRFWGEFMPNVAYLNYTRKWFDSQGFLTYEFRDNKLIRVTEFDMDNWTHYAQCEHCLNKILKQLNIDDTIVLEKDERGMSLPLSNKYSWVVGNVRMSIDPDHEYLLNGEMKKRLSLVFERVE